MRTAAGVVEAATLSEGWLGTLVQVSEAPERKQFHAVTRIADPTAEVEQIRAAADEMLAALDYQLVETVANTIFPYGLALTARDNAELVARYRAMYPAIRRLHKNNQNGTYFGRLVAYPNGDEPLDQLGELIRRIEQERDGGRPKGARYEVLIDVGLADGPHYAQDANGAQPAVDPTLAVPVHVPLRDTSAMAFPCLSLCSFQLDHDYLHLCAHYRSQYLVQRGYGNYLGLARLQSYVAATTGIGVGQMMVVAGMAHADAPKYRIEQAVARAGRTAQPAVVA